MKRNRQFMNINSLRRHVAQLLVVILPVLTAAEADDFSPSTSPTSSPPYPPPILPSFPFPLCPRVPSLSPLDLDCVHVRCALQCDWYCFEPGIPVKKYLDCARGCMDACLERSGFPAKVNIPTHGFRSFGGNFFGYVSKAKRNALKKWKKWKKWKKFLP